MYDYENETNQIPISCWKKFRNPNRLYEIESYENDELLELELEENDEENFTEEIIEQIKEQKYNKVKIEEDDVLLQVNEEKKTVIGKLNKEQENQLREL